MEREPLYGFAVFYDAPFCREPQSPVVLDDAHDVAAGHIESHQVETVLLLVISAEATEGAYPQPSALIHHTAVHLVIGQSMLIAFLVLVLVQCFLLDVVVPESVALCRNPEVSIPVLIDVDGDGSYPTDTVEVVLVGVVEVQSLHRSHPYPTTDVGIDGVAAGIVERVGILRLHILAQFTRLHVEHQHTARIGTYPQFRARETEGMYILV